MLLRARPFLASIVAVTALTATTLSMSTSCSSGGYDPYGGWDGAYPGYDGNQPSVDVFPYYVCSAKTIEVVYDEALMGASPGLIEQGANDVPLSPPKATSGTKTQVSCLHLRVTRDGANVPDSRRLVWLSPSADFSKLEEQVLYRLTKTSSGWKEETDPNGDGAPEQIAETTVDGVGAWTGTVTTTYDGPTKTPLRRFTTAPKDAILSAYREETWNGAGWDLFLDGEVYRDQQKCVSPSDIPTPPPVRPGSRSPTCTTVPCGAKAQVIQDAMKQALRKVENCAPSSMTTKAAAELAAGALKPVCMSGARCGYGETTSEGVATAANPREVRINIDHIGTSQFMPTVWHELVHIGLGARGDHPEMLQSLASLLGKGLLVDRTYACEAMCFPPASGPATQCDCAACLDEVILPSGTTKRATRCTPQCAGFAECPGSTPDTGAFCPRQNVFCDTVGECRTACFSGDDACGQKDPKTGYYKREGGNKSRACNPACD